MVSIMSKSSISNANGGKSVSERALFTLVIVMVVGLLGIIIYSINTSNASKFLSVATIGLLAAGASSFVGGLLGFLFGIPRTLQQDRLSEATTSNINPASELGNEKVNYQANTNLEQISDWLTKILVGVGLTKIAVIPVKLNQIAEYIAKGLGTDGANIFALAIIILFGISGFLIGYLWTRLFLPTAFRQADLSTLFNRVEKANQEVIQVNKKLEELEKQAERDSSALSLAQRQLNPSIDIPEVTQDQLNESFKVASHPVKVQIFNLAQNIRSENWKTDKEKMAQTIPIFKALIASDVEGKFHRNHAQLGYAFKDQSKPDWAQAEAELNKAIELRGPWEDNGWLFYEFNRAISKINQDEGFKSGKESKLEVRDKIIKDLNAVIQSKLKLKELIFQEPDIVKWMAQNGLSRNDLI